ncbi:MAG: hypothetical protein RLZZ150_1261, partial [Bacteroidota bacterium]
MIDATNGRAFASDASLGILFQQDG